MPTRDDVQWFKTEFHKKIEAAIEGTPCTLDMLTAIACQETGYIWSNLRRKRLPTARILELCVGDTLDAPRRGAFPRTKDDLINASNGTRMFAIARQALEDMAEHTGNKNYQKATNNPDKFCHGFGMFQCDLQFFKSTPSYFLNKEYADFDKCLEMCLKELRRGIRKVGLHEKNTLTSLEIASVAIAYNRGSYNPRKGLKQGYFDGEKYYGEYFFDYLRMAQTVALPGETCLLTTPSSGEAAIANPTPVAATGPLYEVDVRNSLLRLRSEPNVDGTNANVLARLPDGHMVQAVAEEPIHGFLEVETQLLGAHYHGYVSTQYLKPAPAGAQVTATIPAVTPPTTGIVAVHMPRRAGTVTRRTEPAGAHSLNEPEQPGRQGTTAEALRSELSAIVNWLSVDNPAHMRYQPNSRATFCNIYAHDYCHLAGVYLPRVWWSQRALVDLAKGKAVQPSYGKTIDELRANDLFRWLRDFGPAFGWRQTSTLTKLQTEVNQGAIGLIVARRVQEGKSGHIVVVVPETTSESARWNSSGEVTVPLQSQAGSTNFRYGTRKKDWWKGVQFAESAFWLHA